MALIIQETFILSVIESTAKWINQNNYEVENESELCHILFYIMQTLLPSYNLKPSQIRSELKIKDRINGKSKVVASIDLAITKSVNSLANEMFIEVKTHIRPRNHKTDNGGNKLDECVKDITRIRQHRVDGKCSVIALIVYEKYSTQLKRNLCTKLNKIFEEHWFAVGRASVNNEHIGVLFISKLESAT
ncbi:hypothetical protein BH10ACI1_BH10ACI1_14870 [soil metagenome]